MTKKATEDRLLVGNCLDTLKTLADDSIDSIVTDPPYEIGFMGKGWDSTGIAYSVELWKECLRVLKPGGHLLSFGATRSYHRMAVAIEDAGFEIRDSIHWTYGSGFPKSMNISKAMDKAAGVKGEVVGSKRVSPKGIKTAETRSDVAAGSFGGEAKDIDITAPATEAAKKWEGWGTALKPSHEPIVVARKPINQTVADNVIQYGTGAINIDDTRVGNQGGCVDAGPTGRSGKSVTAYGDGLNGRVSKTIDGLGRFPANTLLTHNHDCDTTCTLNCPIELLDQQSGPAGAAAPASGPSYSGPSKSGSMAGAFKGNGDAIPAFHDDKGGASRFFHNSQWSVADDLTPFIYQAKPGKKERNAGLDNIEGKSIGAKGNGLARTCATCGASVMDGCECPDRTFINPVKQNFHPTVKPVELIRYLIKMVTPPKGTVLDPFLGSGTTAVAAILEGVEWKGCELTKDYLPIIEGRTAWATKEAKKKAKPKQAQLFE
jgi:site-specific DNA-methyltransferase (adenine-specific)